MSDAVNHPSHYTSHPSGIECIQVVEWMNFNLGNAVKYIWRSDHKNGLEDLKKAAWYIEREIQRLSEPLLEKAQPQPETSLPPAQPSVIFENVQSGSAWVQNQPLVPDNLAGAEVSSYERAFITACLHMIAVVHENARDKGFWDGPRNDGETLALIHSEISEALEALRAGNAPDDKIPNFTGVEAELADVIIRIFDYAGGRKLRIGEAVVAKMRYNKTRGHKHGKRF